MNKISEKKHTSDRIPLVSICVITYNHEKFIKDALESFLDQEVSFDIEIVVHDDASIDETQSILKQYDKKYPGLFNMLLQTENQRSIYGSGMNPRFNYPRARGKYIALCEGDDYWTDPLKLQKQVDFLEANPDLVACHHWQKIAKEINGKYQEFEAPKKGHGYYNKQKATVQEIFSNKLRIKTRTNMFRNVLDNSLFEKHFNNVAFGDVPLSFILGKYGDFGFIDQEMAVYRITGKGVSSAGLTELGQRKFKIQHFKNWIDIWDKANKFYDYKYNKESVSTVNFFFNQILSCYPVNISNYKKILLYNFERSLPLSKKNEHTRFVTKYFLIAFSKRIKNKFKRMINKIS